MASSDSRTKITKSDTGTGHTYGSKIPLPLKTNKQTDTAETSKTQRSVSRNIVVEAEVHSTPDGSDIIGVQSNRKNGKSTRKPPQDGAGSGKVVRFEQKSLPKPATLQTDTGSKRGTDKQKGAAEKPRGRKIPEVSVETGGTNLPNSQGNQPPRGRLTGTKPKCRRDANSNMLNAKVAEAAELCRTRSPVKDMASAFSKVSKVQGLSAHKQQDAKLELKRHQPQLEYEIQEDQSERQKELYKKRMSLDRHQRNQREELDRIAEIKKLLEEEEQLYNQNKLLIEQKPETKRRLESEIQDSEEEGLESEEEGLESEEKGLESEEEGLESEEEGPRVQRQKWVQIDLLNREIDAEAKKKVDNVFKALNRAYAGVKSLTKEDPDMFATIVLKAADRQIKFRFPDRIFVGSMFALYEADSEDKSGTIDAGCEDGDESAGLEDGDEFSGEAGLNLDESGTEDEMSEEFQEAGGDAEAGTGFEPEMSKWKLYKEKQAAKKVLKNMRRHDLHRSPQSLS